MRETLYCSKLIEEIVFKKHKCNICKHLMHFKVEMCREEYCKKVDQYQNLTVNYLFIYN